MKPVGAGWGPSRKAPASGAGANRRCFLGAVELAVLLQFPARALANLVYLSENSGAAV